MRRLAMVLVVLAAAPALQAGEIGAKLATYASAGAGVGAVLGTAVATVPYLQSKEPYDFYTGAGAGMLAGASVGFLLGILDLATIPAEDAAAPSLDGLKLALLPGGWVARYSKSF